MKKRIFVLLAVFVLLLVSVIPSFAYYYDDGDTDFLIGGLWYLPDRWSFTDSYELRFRFYSSQFGDDNVLIIDYSGIRFDFYDDTIEYITTNINGVDTYHLVYDNGWLAPGYREIMIVDLSVDTSDSDQFHYLEFVEYLLDNALDLTYSNFEQAIEQEGELQFNAGYQEGYQEGVNASGGFTHEDIDNAANEGYWLGYEEGSDAGYLAGVDAGFQEGYDAALSDFDSEGIYQTGYDKGKIEGYQLGKRDHETYDLDFPGVIDSYFDGVGRILVDSFGWEIFGINILGTLTALIVVAVLAWFIKKLKGF